jgi:DNA-binding beta-propeller fold protein YncE
MKPLAILLVYFFVLTAGAQQKTALKLVRTIPLPDVAGRIDHMAADTQRHRLFVAALGNNTVEVVDYENGKRLHTITGCSEPQGVVFLPKLNQLFVANGGSYELKIFDGEKFQLLKTIGSLSDADNARYDAANNRVYVGFGSGALGVFDPANKTQAASIPLDGHPESFQIEQNGNRIFVNVPGHRSIIVVDRAQKTVVAKWPLESAHSNFPMTLDEADHRLFIGCRSPARMLVLDTTTGKTVAQIEISGDVDDLFYDAARKRIYVSGGEGFVSIIAQKSTDSYIELEKIPMARGARTSFFIPEENIFCVAVPRNGSNPGEIRVFKVEP